MGLWRPGKVWKRGHASGPLVPAGPGTALTPDRALPRWTLIPSLNPKF